MEEHKKEKKILTWFEKALLFFAIVILAYLAFQRGGFKVAEKSEEITIIDKPHQKEHQQKKRTYTPKPNEEEQFVDDVLGEIAKEFSNNNNIEPNKLNELDLPKDEVEYLQEVKTQHELDETLQSAKDWFQVLKSSHQTYSNVKSLFESVDKKAVEKNKLDQLLKDQKDANEIYNKMEELFGITPEQVTSFARKGQRAMSDWAEFVEEEKKKN